MKNLLIPVLALLCISQVSHCKYVPPKIPWNKKEVNKVVHNVEKAGDFAKGLMRGIFKEDFGNIESCLSDDRDIIDNLVHGMNILKSNEN